MLVSFVFKMQLIVYVIWAQTLRGERALLNNPGLLN